MRRSGNHNHVLLAACLFLAGVSICGLRAADEVKPLDAFPKIDRLWLGTEQGVVRPADYEQFKLGGEGFVQLLVPHGSVLEKGQQWATLNPAQLDADTVALKLAELGLAMDLDEARRTAREDLANRNLGLHELESKRRVLQDALDAGDLAAELQARTRGALQDLDEQIEAARARVTPERQELELRVKLDEIKLQAQRQRNQYETLKRRSELIAGFKGELRLADEIREALDQNSDEQRPIWLKDNQAIGTIVNEDSYEITVTGMATMLGNTPPEELIATLHDARSGRLIVGEFSGSEEVDRGGEIERTYMFKVQENSIDDARRAMGQMNMVNIYRKFDEPFHLIFKKEIAFVAPEVLSKGGWSALVGHLWQGAEVIQVGPQAIAVKVQDEN